MGSYSEEAEVSRMVEMWREHPPSSYSLKIHNFSQLENSSVFSDHKYQSRFFSSGGYKWRLIVYPKGNKKEEGSGFISMYVELDNTSLMISTPPTPTELFAELRFYVYNKKLNKYFTIQDVEVKRFNALRTVWGIQQVIACDIFNNPENGYVFEGDQCEFGVDVIVVSPLTKWEILSFNQKLFQPKLYWKIYNFSLSKEYYASKNIFMGGKNWVLKLYPKGCSKTLEGKYLSVFLNLDDTEKPKADEKIFTQGYLRVLNPLGSNHLTAQINHWYTGSSRAWSWDQFSSLAEFGKVYLDKEDTLSLEIEFEVVSTTKYSPTV